MTHKRNMFPLLKAGQRFSSSTGSAGDDEAGPPEGSDDGTGIGEAGHACGEEDGDGDGDGDDDADDRGGDSSSSTVRPEREATALTAGRFGKDGKYTGISWSVKRCRVLFLMCACSSNTSFARLYFALSPRTA